MANTKGITQQKAVTILRFLYPLWMVVGLFSIMFVPSKLIVWGNAAETASNIVSNELLFSAGIVGSLITQLIFLFAALLLYKVFEKVNKDQSLLMLIFVIIGVPIAMLNTLNRVAALLLAKGTEYFSSIDPAQLQSQMMFFLDLNNQGAIIAAIFWGLWLFPLGYLIYKSGYFPKWIGISVIIGGFGYFLGSLSYFLLPSSLSIIHEAFDILTFGEMIFIFWIIIRGAKLPSKKK